MLHRPFNAQTRPEPVLGRRFRPPLNGFLNSLPIIDGIASGIPSRRSLHHNVIQGLCREISPAPHSFRRNANHRTFADWKYLMIDLKFSAAFDKDIDFLIELMPVVKRHGSVWREFIE